MCINNAILTGEKTNSEGGDEDPDSIYDITAQTKSR